MADRAHSTSRRALLAGLTTSSTLARPLAAFALSTTAGAGAAACAGKARAGTSDLAPACDWARRREAFLDDLAVCEALSEAQLDAEIDVIQAVYRRAIVEPSASPAELAAKARLVLADLARHEKLHPEDTLDQLTGVVLAEVAALGGAA